jgi:hypothetical protein
MRAHYVHEPEHINGAKRCMTRYLDVLPAQSSILEDGAQAYLNLYQRMFQQLDTEIFG